jgi:hypothetical protein
MEDVMTKALDVNDDPAQNQERQPRQQPGQQKLQGKALQINENSVEDQKPDR